MTPKNILFHSTDQSLIQSSWLNCRTLLIKNIEKAFTKEHEIISLPLLQYTLSRLWEKRHICQNGDSIDLETIAKFKGTSDKIDLFRVLNWTADEQFDKWKHPPYSVEIFKNLFLNLININSVRGSSLCARKREDLSNSWELAENLATSGLIRTFKENGTDYAEITHEALIEHWDRLKGWVEEAKKASRVKDTLEKKAAEWKSNNPRCGRIDLACYSLFNKDNLLLRGKELKEAVGYAKEPTSALPDAEKDFLIASKWHSWIINPLVIVIFVLCILLLGIIFGYYRYSEGIKDQLEKDTLARLSLGEKYFFTQATQEDSNKREGVWHFGKRKEENYTKAISAFEKHVNKHDDPEARIYLNNARFLKKYEEKKLPIIAVSVPIQKNVTISKEILRGVAHAQDDVWECISEPEQCPPDSRKQFPFLVMLASDDNDPEVAERIAEHLVHGELPKTTGGIAQQGYVIAVVGHNASDVTKAVMPIYQNKMVMISPTSTTLSSDDIKVKVNQKKDNFTYLISYPNKDLALNLVNLSKFEKEKELLYCHDEKVDKAKLEEGFKGVIDSAGTKCVFKHNEAESVLIPV